MKLNMLKSENTGKAIAFTMSLSLVAKIFTLIQSLVVSYAFGTQKSTDILFYVMSTIALLTSLISSVNQQVLVPAVIIARNNISEDDSKKFILFIYLVLTLLCGLATIILFLSPVKILSAVSKFDIVDLQANIKIIGYIIPTFLLTVINTYILDIFISYRYFTLPMLLDMTKSIMITVFVLLLKGRFSVSSMAMGVFWANMTQYCIMNVLLLKGLKCRFSLKYYKIAGLVKKNIVYVLSGQVVAFAAGFFVMYLISGFETGVYTAMDYGQKINTLLKTVVVGQISTVIGMNIIELYSKSDYGKLNDTFLNCLKTGMFFIMPFCFILFLNSEAVISLLFERGEFTYGSVKLTAGFFAFFILAVPFGFIDTIIVRLIIAKQIQKIAFIWQIFYNIMSVPLIWVMVKTTGYYGYPAGELISTIVYVFLLAHFLLKSQFEYIRSNEAIRFTFLNIVLNAVIACLMYYGMHKLGPGRTFMHKAFNITVSSAVYLSIYTAAGYCTGLNRDVILGALDFTRKVFRGKHMKDGLLLQLSGERKHL